MSTETADSILRARFAALANPLDESDWLDVRRRARGPRRRWLAAPLAAGLAVVLAGSAFALYREIVDFLSAEPAPERIVIEFGQQGVYAAAGLGPRVIPDQARRVTEAEAGGRLRVLYVAPTEDGGFCWRWGSLGSCGRTHATQSVLGVVVMESPEAGASLLAGHLLDTSIARLELTYEDGGTVEIPTVWVSPPIAAGFYLFDVPRRQLAAGHRPQVLRALGGESEEIATYRFRYSDPRWETEPDGLPRAADRTEKRTLFDFSDHTGARRTLVVAPAPGDRLCYAHERGGGCLSPRFPATIDGMGVQGGQVATVCCAVGDGVASVELQYEDGAVTRLEPVAGFLLYVIPPEHYRVGHRLERIVWRAEAGNEVAARAVATDLGGVYPCERSEERELGYGVTMCP